MGHLSGRVGFVDTAAAVTGIKSWTIDYTIDTLETTDFASAGVKSFIVGGYGWSGTFEGYKDGVPQTLGTTTAITLKLYEDASTLWSGSAYITGVHGTAAQDGIVSYNYDYQGTGTLTVPTG